VILREGWRKRSGCHWRNCGRIWTISGPKLYNENKHLWNKAQATASAVKNYGEFSDIGMKEWLYLKKDTE
jgi:hypothetical protein